MQTLRRCKVRDQATEHLGFHAGLLDVDPHQLIDTQIHKD